MSDAREYCVVCKREIVAGEWETPDRPGTPGEWAIDLDADRAVHERCLPARGAQLALGGIA